MQRFKNILLCISEAHLSDAAAQRAIALARSNKAKLTIIDILPVSSLDRSLLVFSDKIEHMQKEVLFGRQQELEALAFEFSRDIDVRVEVLSGKPFIEIIRCVQRHGCDLVLKSVDEDKRITSILFGSTDLRLLRKCPCPVWLVKRDDHRKSRKIMAAVQLEILEDEEQLDQLNNQIMEISTSLALRESSQLHIVNAWMVFGGEPLAKKLSKHYAEDVDFWISEQKRTIEANQKRFVEMFRKHLFRQHLEHLDCRFHFIEGEAEEVIIDVAAEQEIDLVVMGTVARTDLAGFFVGNTSEAVLHRLNCSVLAVKPPGFVSPVTDRRS